MPDTPKYTFTSAASTQKPSFPMNTGEVDYDTAVSATSKLPPPTSENLPGWLNAILDKMGWTIKPLISNPIKEARVQARAHELVYGPVPLHYSQVDRSSPAWKAALAQAQKEDQEPIPVNMPWTKTVVELGDFIGSLVEGFSTPENLTLLVSMAATEGGALIPRAAPIMRQMQIGERLKAINAMVNAGFSAQQATTAYEQVSQGVKAWQSGDLEQAKQLLSSGVAQSLFSTLGAIGTVKGAKDVQRLRQGQRDYAVQSVIRENLERGKLGYTFEPVAADAPPPPPAAPGEAPAGDFSAAPAAERTKSGKLKMGARAEDLADVLGSSLYENRGAGIIVKELMQNAFDATRLVSRPQGQKGNVKVYVNEDMNQFTILDDGPGMTEEEIFTVFSDLGASGKRGDASASGGFGLAKAAPFMIADKLMVVTRAYDPKRGYVTEVSFTSTPETIKKGEVDVKVTKADRNAPLGTKVTAVVKPDDIFDVYSFARRAKQSVNAPAEVEILRRRGSKDYQPYDLRYYAEEGTFAPVVPLGTEKIPGAKVTLFRSTAGASSIGGILRGLFDSLEVEINNNGIYQFSQSFYAPYGKKFSGKPVRLIVDINSTVPEGHPDYPFNASRERLSEVGKHAIKELIDEHIVKPAIDKANAELADAYGRMKAGENSPTGPIPFMDAGTRLIPEDVNVLRENTAFLQLTSGIREVAIGAINFLREMTENAAQKWGDSIEDVGIVFSDNLRGVFIPNPDGSGKGTILINPFSALSHKVGVGMYGTEPLQIASSVWATILHEIVHERVKGHNESFTTTLGELNQRLGGQTIRAILELEELYAGPTGPDKKPSIRADLDSAISVYENSRKRAETAPDIFRGEELATGPKQPQPRATPEPAPELSDSGADTVREGGEPARGGTTASGKELIAKVVKLARSRAIPAVDVTKPGSKVPIQSWMSPDGNWHLPATAIGHDLIARKLLEGFPIPPTEGGGYGAMFEAGWIRKAGFDQYTIGNKPTKEQLEGIELNMYREGVKTPSIILEYFDRESGQGVYMTLLKQDIMDSNIHDVFNAAVKKNAGSRYNTLMYSGIDPVSLVQSLGSMFSRGNNAANAAAQTRTQTVGAQGVAGLIQQARQAASIQGLGGINKSLRTSLYRQGIDIGLPAEDLGIMARFLGSATQQLNRFAQKYHIPAAAELSDMLANTAIYINRNILQDRKIFHTVFSHTYRNWDELVRLLNDPEVNVTNISTKTQNKEVWVGYVTLRKMLDRHREMIIQARREGDLARGLTLQQALEHTPDDWGIGQGYFPHIFDGNWVIMESTPQGTHAIPEGWRQTTLDDALKIAQKVKAARPNAQLIIELDLGSRFKDSYGSLFEGNKLKAILNELKDAYKLQGPSLDAALRRRIGEAIQFTGALRYGPSRPVQRFFGQAMERESNLPGWLNTKEGFELYIRGVNRYIALYESRPKLLKLRNELATWQRSQGLPTDPNVMSITELNPRTAGSNLLGRIDSAIEALEGYPNWFEQNIRNWLERRGHDPRMADSAIDFILEVEALLKLGYSPISALTNLSQTLIATYPVLGEKYTLMGIQGLLSSKYDPLLRSLGIEAQASRLEIQSIADFKRLLEFKKDAKTGQYRVAKTSTAFQGIQKLGLLMFSKAEFANRAVAAIGAFEKALAEGRSPAMAAQYAQDVVIRTQGLYHSLDQAHALRLLPRPMSQFKSFQFKIMEFMTGLKGKEVLRFIPAILIGGGLSALPGIALLYTLYKMSFGEDAEAMAHDLGRATKEAVGFDINRGLPSVLDVDLSRNLGYGEWFGPEFLRPDERLLGPAGSDLFNAVKGSKYLFSDAYNALTGENVGAIGNESVAARDAATAFWRGLSPAARRVYDFSQKNLLDPRTKDVILRDLSMPDRLRMLVGATPSRIADEQERNRRANEAQAKDTDTRSWYINELANVRVALAEPDITEEDRKKLMAYLPELIQRAVSEGVYDARLARSVIDRSKQKQMERAERDVRNSPRRIRKYIFELVPENRPENRPQ